MQVRDFGDFYVLDTDFLSITFDKLDYTKSGRFVSLVLEGLVVAEFDSQILTQHFLELFEKRIDCTEVA